MYQGSKVKKTGPEIDRTHCETGSGWTVPFLVEGRNVQNNTAIPCCILLATSVPLCRNYSLEFCHNSCLI